MKKILLSFLFITILNTYSIPIEKPHHKTTIIVSNLEDVVISKNYPGIIKNIYRTFFDAHNKWQIIGMFFRPSFWKDIAQSMSKKLYYQGKLLKHNSDYIFYYASKYKALYEYKDHLMHDLNEYKISEEIIIFYLWLKLNRNYPIYLATNKNAASYHIIKKKLDLVLKNRFGIAWDDLFDGAFYIDKYKNKQNKIPYTHLEKPKLSYFVGLWEYLTHKRMFDTSNSQILYIDDAQQNIVGAQQTYEQCEIPIFGITFKNIQQIKNTITTLIDDNNSKRRRSF